MATKPQLKSYFKVLADVAGHGDAREESFYACLQTLFQEFAANTDRTGVHVTILPRKTEAGIPDFRVWNGKDRIIGYIEAKHPTMSRAMKARVSATTPKSSVSTSTPPSTLNPCRLSSGSIQSAVISCWPSG